ncbi:EAL and HDOD domain-containing protein [Aliiglaciecola sp. M165]|uniref:EAL and HDOD domain-containing protein n=1 Tax=Aliiglaciecola sp. M165 TaxID=2593649 RepID=UPI00117F1A6D|nr:HDOD domain-containing protein [Aliiglaciecola sp. M165]TRY29082.1 HDOD domain-containing protein [Aliiglaciecola sp. M165]
MFAYVARQAIFDRDKNVHAYELLFRDGKSNCFPDIEPDEATSKLITGSHLALGVEEITSGKTAFINFHNDTLLYRFPTSLDPHSIVIEIVETVDISDQLVSACKHIKNLGYKIALDDHDFDPKWDVLIPFVHTVKVDIVACDFDKIKQNIQKFKDAKLKLVAERVETKEQFERCLELGFDSFQGYFFAKPEVMKQKNIPSSKLILLDLMRVSASTDFDFERISQIIEKDVALSYMLLRFINNPIMNKRNKITSLNHALTYMGEVEIKKFIALLALANLGDNKPPELVHLSLVRARFCELVAIAKKEANNPPKGFLVGLFSLLDALLDQNMEQLMEKLPLSDDLKGALCGMQSQLRDYLSMARAFEFGDWSGVKRHAAKLALDQRMLHSFYNESIKWGASMTGSIRR